MAYKSSLILVAGLALATCAQSDRMGSGSSYGNPGSNGSGSAAFGFDSQTFFASTVEDRVFFAVDESALTPRARQILADQARWLFENHGYQITVEGHADERGTREYNLALGARRASAVQQFLIAQGIDPGRIRTVTYGKERPVEICSVERCYAKNRRAVTVLNAGVS